MPQTRRQQRLIDRDIWNQNTSQPICRLGPELISEIFLHARPDVFAMRNGATWVELVRYLASITSITGHLRRIALDYGELWSAVGFHVTGPQVDFNKRYKRVLIVIETFLERARTCNLHFYFHDSYFHERYLAPSWFYPRLLALIMPRIEQARTIRVWAGSSWKQLCVILNNAVNVNNLSLIPSLPISSTPPLNVLLNLKELTLSRIVYDESFHEILKQVEKLDLTVVDTDLWKWLGSFVQLKWLRIPDINYTDADLTTPNFLVRLDSFAYLGVRMRLYHSIAPQLSLPHLRHLSLHPCSDPRHEPQDCRHPLRTLCIKLDLQHVHLLPCVMNPRFEHLQISQHLYGSELLTLLSELLNPSQSLTLPSGATFPGPSLKYFRLIYSGVFYDTQYEAPLSERLASILTKAPHLKLDVVARRSPPGFEGLMKQFPSQVKRYQRVYSVPLDELYERSRKDNE